MEDREDVLPAGHDVGGSGANHLRYTANNHVTNGHRSEERVREIVHLLRICSISVGYH